MWPHLLEQKAALLRVPHLDLDLAVRLVMGRDLPGDVLPGPQQQRAPPPLLLAALSGGRHARLAVRPLTDWRREVGGVRTSLGRIYANSQIKVSCLLHTPKIPRLMVAGASFSPASQCCGPMLGTAPAVSGKMSPWNLS